MNDSIRQAVNDRFVMDYDNIPGKGSLILFRKWDDGTMSLATPDHIVEFVKRWSGTTSESSAALADDSRPSIEADKPVQDVGHDPYDDLIASGGLGHEHEGVWPKIETVKPPETT